MKYNMTSLTTGRFHSFNKESQDVVTCGIDLYRHYQFLHNEKKEYAEFAVGGTYEAKSLAFTDQLQEQAIFMSGLRMPEGMGRDKILAISVVQEMMFALVSEMLDVIVPNTILQEFYRIAEVKNVSWGDTLLVRIPSPDLFVVSKIANGVREGEPQRLFSQDVPLNPVFHEITIQEDFFRVISGQVDWGMWVAKVAQSMETAISIDVYNQIFASYSSLPTQLKVAAYSQPDFVKLAARITALNRGAKCIVMGTQVALSNILPTNDYLKMALGAEYNQLGYLGSFHQVDLLEIPQKIIASTLDFAIDDNTLYFISLGVDKPIKIGFEGSTLINVRQNTENADYTFVYTLMRKYEVKIATASRYGIMKV